MNAPASSNDSRRIPIKIDGEVIHLESPDQIVRDLLELAGVDPDEYDLCRLGKQGDAPVQFTDDAELTVSPGDKFVTKAHAGQVA